MNQRQRQTIYEALHGHANYIETGDFTLSAADKKASDDAWRRDSYRHEDMPRVLDREQMRLVVYLRDLADAILSGEVKP